MRAALAAAEAGGLLRRALVTADIEGALRSAEAVDVVAVGKAAGPMLLAAVSGVVSRPLRHVVGVSSQPAPVLPAGARWHAAAHPVPDDRSVTAARAVLDTAGAANDRDLLLLLLSGGASALMALPADGISLEDKQRTSERLLREGAEIHALNAVRKHLSAIKGGQLAAAAGGSVLTLAVSDVVGDQLSTIGSGPSVPDTTTFADALSELDQHGGRDRYPSAVVARLTAGVRGAIPETPKAGDPRLSRSAARVIGGAWTAVDGARAAAQSLGYVVHVVEAPVDRERPALQSRRLLDAASWIARDPRRTVACVLAAGEMTVRVVRAPARADATRNARSPWHVDSTRSGRLRWPRASAPTVWDGPTDAAGGVVDSTTLARAEAAGLGPPERYLDDNNSYVFLDELGDLIRTGPTNTNVGDLQVILVGGRERNR